MPVDVHIEPSAAADERAFANRVLRAEAEAVAAVAARLDASFSEAVRMICRCADAGGAVVVTGMGKSGLIGRKISATLASLGVPSHEVHPADALHGDLGRLRSGDCVLALSYSGETEEVLALAQSLRQDGVGLISITGGEGRSTLARLADVALTLGRIDEAGDLGLAPTCSTTATLALGDALALAAARRRSFTEGDFARRHPGGALGGLLRPVGDALRFSVARDNLPLIAESLTVREALDRADAMARRPGALLAVDDAGVLTGIFTDADLRRLVRRDPAGLDQPLASVMTRHPRTLAEDALVRDAVHMVREHRQDEIPVVDPAGRPTGLLDVQDLMALRVVES